MNVEILIVTYRKDFTYLWWCLKSISKFAAGFAGLTIIVPEEHEGELIELQRMFMFPFPVKRIGIKEWPGKGMLGHMNDIMHADVFCPDAEFIVHTDADCIFTEPVTPETFIKDGKPILQYERFTSIGKRHPGVMQWWEATQKCLPFPVQFETMRGHGETYHRDTYAQARKLVEQKTGMPISDYIRSGQNAYPQSYCEFVTLGSVAMQCFPERYHLVDCARKPNPDKSDFPVFQAWSHGAIDKPQKIWVFGVEREVVPLHEFKRYLA